LRFIEKFVKESDVPEQATYDTRNGQENEDKLYSCKTSYPKPLFPKSTGHGAARIFNKPPAVLKVIEEKTKFLSEN
jgi:hypothetical protein